MRGVFGFNAEQFFAAQWEVLQFAMVTEMTVVWWQMAKSTMYDNRGGGWEDRESRKCSRRRGQMSYRPSAPAI